MAVVLCVEMVEGLPATGKSAGATDGSSGRESFCVWVRWNPHAEAALLPRWMTVMVNVPKVKGVRRCTLAIIRETAARLS